MGPRILLYELGASLFDSCVRNEAIRFDDFARDWTNEMPFLVKLIIILLQLYHKLITLVFEVLFDIDPIKGQPTCQHDRVFHDLTTKGA